MALLLPGLLLRALIPIGFMPMFGPGLGIQMMLCPDYAPVPAMEMSMDMSMDLPDGAPAQGLDPKSDLPAGQHHSDRGECAFAASASFGGPPAASGACIARPTPTVFVLPASQVVRSSTTPRTQSPRGPPLDV